MVALSTDLCAPWIGFDEVHRLTKYAALTEAQVAPFLMPASELCYKLSGRKFRGVCSVTKIRPCRLPTYDPHGSLSPVPGGGGLALWWGACRCGGDPWVGMCQCTLGIDQLDLDPYTPVVSIDAVRIDGVLFAASGYTVYDWQWLARTDGQFWPISNRMDRPDTAAGTWAIDLHFGEPPPEDAQLAAAQLAGELALANNPGSGTCILPERIQSITRQGITYLVSDPQTYLDSGRTGIYLIDLWLRATNPSGVVSRATLSYPGQVALPGRRRVP